MYDIAHKTIEIMLLLFQGYCLHYFAGNFLDNRFFERRWTAVLVIILYTSLNLAVRTAMPGAGDDAWIFWRLAAQIFILLTLTLPLYKAFHVITVFLIVTFMAINQICLFLAHIVLQVGGKIFDLWAWMFAQQYFHDVHSYELIIEISVLGLFLLHGIVSAVVTYFSLKGIARNFRESNRDIGKTELFFILTPSMTGLLICILLREIIITVDGNVPELIYDKHPLLVLLVPVILLLSLLSIQYGVKLFQDMIERNRERNNIIILEKQVGNMQAHIEEMERVYTGIRSIRHDMKNTVSVIMRLATESGNMNNSELSDYLFELNRAMDELEQHFKTGNTVVDTLLNMKYHEAVRLLPGITVEAENLVFPADLSIQSYDIGIIMGNALDNAIDACKRLRAENAQANLFISLSSFCRGNMFFLEMKNSFNGNIIHDKKTGIPKTSKTDKNRHGIGFENIRNTAEKYQGAVEWSAANRVFTLSIMMQNKKMKGEDVNEHNSSKLCDKSLQQPSENG